jgi:biotin transport system substrate-specific component
MLIRHAQGPAAGETTLLSSSLVEFSPSLALAVRVGAVLFVTALTAAAAQMAWPLPFTPIPLTVQPMIVLLGGAALGSRLGALSQLLYLAAGVAGLPVFAAVPGLAPGVARLLGPTGGYLLSYPLAAFVVGALAERGLDRRYVGAVLSMLAGLAVVYATGAFWLGLVLRTTTGGAAAGALALGVLPFIAFDIVKVLFAAGILPAIRRSRQ